MKTPIESTLIKSNPLSRLINVDRNLVREENMVLEFFRCWLFTLQASEPSQCVVRVRSHMSFVYEDNLSSVCKHLTLLTGGIAKPIRECSTCCKITLIIYQLLLNSWMSSWKNTAWLLNTKHWGFCIFVPLKFIVFFPESNSNIACFHA